MIKKNMHMQWFKMWTCTELLIFFRKWKQACVADVDLIPYFLFQYGDCFPLTKLHFPSSGSLLCYCDIKHANI